jgi:hypothetical protein
MTSLFLCMLHAQNSMNTWNSVFKNTISTMSTELTDNSACACVGLSFLCILFNLSVSLFPARLQYSMATTMNEVIH